MKKSALFIVMLILLTICFAFAACGNVDTNTVSDAVTIANLKTDVGEAFEKLTYVSALTIDNERCEIAFTVKSDLSEIAFSEIKLTSGSVTVFSSDGTPLSSLTLNEGQNTFMMSVTSGTITLNYTVKITRNSSTADITTDPDPTTDPIVEPTTDPDPLEPVVEPPHTHTYAETWSKDDEHHWHAATCEHTDEVKDKAAHAWDAGTITSPASEEMEGVKTYRCTVCGATKTEPIEKLEHVHTFADTWSKDDDYHWHAATCEHAVEIKDKAFHAWDGGAITTPASEISEGVRTYTCTVCGATKTESIEKLAHVHTYADTWSKDEEYHWHAATCGHTDEVKEKAAHIWQSTFTHPATEEADGFILYACSVCAATKTVTLEKLEHVHTFSDIWSKDDDYHWHAATCEHTDEVKDKAAHTWDAGTITSPASEEMEGVETYRCTVCGVTKTESIEKLAHVHTYADTWSRDEEYHWHAATCGHTDEVKDKAAHNWQTTFTHPATEESEGFVLYACSVCAATKTETLSKLEHKHSFGEWETYNPATCTEKGEERRYCASCGEYESRPIEIDPNAHAIVNHSAQTPTCTETGWNAYETCSRCDYTTYDPIEATGHSSTDWITITEPTCTEKGTKHKICSICSKELEVGEIDSLGHDLIHHNAQAATCTEIGWDAYDTCSRCDYTTYEPIEATGHDYEAVVTPPTCTEKGYTTYTCSHCFDFYYADETETLGHDYAFDSFLWTEYAAQAKYVCANDKLHIVYYNTEVTSKVTTEPSCEEEGTRTYTASYGGHIDTKLEIIDAIGHTASDWITITEPTCTEKGTKHKICSICSKELEVGEIDSLGHDLIHHNAQAATCTEIGWDAYDTCSRCDYTTYEPIEATGHDYEAVVTPPTCTEKGYTTYTCSHCSDYYVENGEEAAGHSFDDSGFCSVCGAEKPATKGLVFVELDDGTYQVSGYNGTDKEVVIPSLYNDCPVTKIKPFAFAGAEITSIIIPTSVSSIGIGALMECSQLEKITIPFVGAKARIAEDAAQYPFGYIFGSNNYEGSAEVKQKYNGEWIYYYIPTSLLSVTVTGGELRDNAFLNCSGLTSVTISGNIKALGEKAFFGCSSLTTITFTDKVTFIGADAFDGCAALSAVDYKGEISSWMGISFASSKANPLAYAHNLYINDSLLTEIAISDGVTNIGDYVFCGCGLTSVTIPSSVISIGDGAFFNCPIERATIPADAISSLPKSSLETVDIIGGASIAAGAFEGCDSLTSITIPASVTSIGSAAFSGCVGLTSILIPESVTSIGFAAFSGCASLESITIPFVGASADGNSNTHFGYIFGASSSYNADDVPSSLKIVVITGSESIGSSAFYGCSSLTSITISSSVMRIGSSAFSGCTGLTSITIPDSVTSIEGYAFYGCCSLESMTIPFVGAVAWKMASDTYQYPFGYIFGTSSYTGGTAVTQYYYGSSTSSTTNNTYYIPSALRSVTVTGGNILYGAFYNCSMLTAVTLGGEVTSIGSYAFSYCTGLTSVAIPEGVTSISDNSFYNCTGLASITIPDNVTSIGSYAFSGCTGLASITIPDNVTNIGSAAFSGCASLKSMTIPFVGGAKDGTSSRYFGYIFGTRDYGSRYDVPSSLKTVVITGSESIGSYAFEYCSGLTSITIPASVTTIASSAFYDCSGLTSIYYEGDIAGWCAISGLSNLMYYGASAKSLYINGTKIEGNFEIPEGVTSIEGSAFRDCIGLTSITVPSSMTSIGENAFFGCCKLVEVYNKSSLSITAGGWTSYGYIGYYAKAIYTSEYASKLSTDEYGYIVYADGEENILMGYVGDQTDLSLPATITSIYSYAFSGCYNLTSITISSSVTSIGKYAFSNCTLLTSITIPASVTSIGSSAFHGCSALKSIYYEGDVAEWCAISGLSNLPSSKTLYIGETKVAGDFVIPAGVTNIGEYAFYNCSDLTSITLSSSVTSIGSYAFRGCSGLISVIVTEESRLTSVASNAFNYCTKLTYNEYDNACYWGDSDNPYVALVKAKSTDITQCVIHEATRVIVSRAFAGCSVLTSVTIPDSVTSIGSAAFSGCTALESMTIPFVGASADGNSNTQFGYIFGLKSSYSSSYDIPSSLKTVVITGRERIASYAFSNCSGLASVTFAEDSGLASIEDHAFYNCTGLTSITIPSSVTSIGSYAFSGCGGLASVTFAENSQLASIEDHAFYNSTGLTSITIPSSVTVIGYEAFRYCSGLTSVTITENSQLTSVGSSAFDGCSRLIYNEYGNAYYLGEYIILFRNKSTSITQCDIHENTRIIYSNAFDGCGNLTSMTIPASVMSVASGAFRYCYDLTSVDFAAGSQLTSIGSSAFYNCNDLVSIAIPSSVTSIGYDAFYNCTRLTSIYYEGDVAGWCAISGLSNLLNYGSSSKTLYIGETKVEGEFVIPEGVASIGDYAFYKCTGLTSVTIPSSVTNIGSYAFSDCAGLTSITIPDSVTSIGNYAFYGCSGLTSITIPSSVTSIGNYEFYNCRWLTSITIPASVTSIGSSAFYNCSGLTAIYYEGDFAGWCSISGLNNLLGYGASSKTLYINGTKVEGEFVIPEGVASIENYAFYNCKGLTSVTIPSSVTNIGSYAFFDCKGLTSVTIPDSVTSIGNYAFYGCSGLTSVTFAEGSQLTSIGQYVFRDCTGLTSIAIPNSVTSIGEYAFSDCTCLISITIPSSMTSIGSSAFYNCSGLTAIYYEGDFAGWCSISGLSNLMACASSKSLYINGTKMEGEFVIPKGVASIGNCAFYNCRGLTSITIPSSVTSIGSQAFCGCTGLTSITIPDSVTSIGSEAFYNCKLTSIYYEGDLTEWFSISGLYSLLRYGASSKSLSINGVKVEGDFVIPDGVTSVGASAFYNCTGLTSIKMPATVTNIGSSAFSGCTGLASITIPASVTNIGSSAFSGCVGLASVIFADGCQLKDIGEYVFRDCSALTSIIIPASVISIYYNAFSGCYKLVEVYNKSSLPITAGSSDYGYVGYYAKAIYTSDYDSKLFTDENGYVIYIEGEEVILIGYAGYQTELTIPSTITSIQACAFDYRSDLTSITIPSSVTRIGDYAFRGCTGLTSITIPDSVTSIGYYVLSDCSSLERMTIPFVGNSKEGASHGSIRYFFGSSGEYYYSGVIPSTLKTVIITGGTSIESYAFYNCSMLTSITIPEGVASIGSYAFYGCSGLTSIAIPNSVTSIGDYAFYDCTGLTSIMIPSGVSSIGNQAFYGCYKLVEVYNKTSLSITKGSSSYGYVGYYAKEIYTSDYDSKLSTDENGYIVYSDGEKNILMGYAGDQTDLTLPTTVTSISDYAFYDCSSLTSVTIPDSVTSIGSYAFRGCTGLTSITIPDSVTSISACAFYGCSSLTSVMIPSSVTSIGSSAFYGCTSLESITIPFVGASANGSSNRHLGYIFGANSYSYNADYVPSSLKTVVITGGKSIGSNAFYKCTGLIAITIPDSVTSIGDYAFYGCNSLTYNEYGNALYLGDTENPYKVLIKAISTDITQCIIHEDAKLIAASAFSGCTSLESITIPFVGASADGSSNTHFGYIFGARSYSYNADYVPSSLKNVVIAGGESIGQYAFYNCANLMSITISTSVTSIGNYAFNNCSSLTSVTFAEGSRLKRIGYDAFYGCSALTSITIPSSVTSIGEFAFSNCTRLTSITIPDSVTRIGSAALSGCTALESITIPFVGAEAGKTASDTYQYPFGYIFGTSSYAGGTAVTQYYYGRHTSSTTSNTYYIPSALRSVTVTGGNILYGAFYNCSMLTSITLHDGVTSIGSQAFYNCTRLTSIYYEGDVAGWCAISGLGNLLNYGASSKEIYINGAKVEGDFVIPEGVTSIGQYALYKCAGLTSITIPASVTSIGSNAFYGCDALNSIYYEGDAAGWCAISGLNNLMNYGASAKSLSINGVKVEGDFVIPDGATSIGEYAFCNCTGLTSITLSSSVTSIESYAFYGCSGLESIYYEGDVAGWCAITGLSNLLNYGTASKSLYIDGTKVEEIVIPNGVTSIEYGSFSGCRGLISITIPASVTSIGSGAFSGCVDLISVTFAEDSGLTSIGSSAFYDCSSLTSITIPSGVTSIGWDAFFGCTGLTAVTFAENSQLASIGANSFVGCAGLTSITIPSSVTRIEAYAFSGCTGLTSVIVTDNSRLTSISSSAFYGCSEAIFNDYADALYLGNPKNPYVLLVQAKNSDITQCIIHENTRIIGDSAFSGCAGLTSITIPGSVTSIGESAFVDCPGITSVTFAEESQLTSIGSFAFEYCSGLTSITIPASVTSIESAAFSGCASLESITIPFVGAVAGKTASDTYQYPLGYMFGTSSYAGGTAVTQYYYGRYTSSTTSNTYYIPSALRSVTVTGGNILYGAFYNCSMLTSITLHDGVTSIGSQAFYNCTRLTSITIPEGVASIGSYAFYGCSGLTSITIPASVTSIGSNAFYGCSSLISITIPSSMTSIGSYEFYNCRGLTSITIPASVTSIGSYAFSGCSGLQSIFYEGTLAGWCSISGLNNLMSYGSSSKSLSINGTNVEGDFVIPEGVTSIGDYVFYKSTGLTTITIPESVTSIGSYAFYYCRGLTSVTFAEGSRLTNISDNAFYNCTGLTSITIPSSVTRIGYQAFYGCSGLKSIHYEGTLVGWCSISGLNNLMSYGSSSKSLSINGTKIEGDFVIPEGVTSVGSYAFYGCAGLTSVTIPSSVTSIGEYAFYSCKGLTSITVPEGVTSIGSYAFSGCCKLVEVYNKSSLSITKGSSSYGYVGYYAKAIYTSEYASKLSTDENGYIVYTDGEENILMGYVGDQTDLSLPVTITSIYSYAFSGCNLTSITIPENVTSIGTSAFEGCSSLESITIPFVGATSWKTASSAEQYPFGYIFGNLSYAGGTAVEQRYYHTWGATATPTYYIPSSLREVTVLGKNIPYAAFYNCTMMTSITLGEDVTSIGKDAFYNCTGLTTICYGGDIEGWCAISGLDNLMTYGSSSKFLSINGTKVAGELVIPDGVTVIGAFAFYGCAELTSVRIPSSVTSIGAYAFDNCTGLTFHAYDNALYLGDSVNPYFVLIQAKDADIAQCVIHESTRVIAAQAFSGCTSLTSITIPSSVTSIGSSAFDGCSSLTSVMIPSSVTSIGSNAFYGCSSLTSITIPASVTSIESEAFSGCASLESITIPFVGAVAGKTASDTYQYPFGYLFGSSSYEGGIAVGQYYYGSSVTGLTYSSYYIPASLRSVTVLGGDILYGAFYNCSMLTSITLGEDVTSIGKDTFYNCTGLTTICYGGDVAGWCAIPGLKNLMTYGSSSKSLYINGTKVAGELVIPSSVTSIGHAAFYGCTSLESITIPFVGAAKDETSNTYFGYIFGANSYSDNSSCIPSALRNVTVTGGDILYGAFYNCSMLTSVTLGEAVTSIGDEAFRGCTGLTSITIPESVTSIGSSAFSGCTGLASITIPASVTSIGSGAFSGCVDLISVTFAEGSQLTSIGYQAFRGCTGLTSITIPASVTSIGSNAFSGCIGLTSITFAEGSQLTSILSHAFDGCSGLTSVYYEGDVAGWCAISGLYELMNYGSSSISIYFNGKKLEGELVIADGATSIGDYAFYGCSSLTSVTIPASVTSIGSYSFYYCTGLTSITFAEGSQLTSIGYQAFRGCTGLASITIPASVTSIGSGAFSGCVDLISVTFAEGSQLTSIGSAAFSGCTALESMTIPFVGAEAGKTASDKYQYPFGYIFDTSGYTGATAATQYYYGYYSYSNTNTTYYIPSSLRNVTVIGGNILYGAFYNCSMLTSITLGEDVMSVGGYAFYNCSGLTSIAIPASVTSIGESAFGGCSSLESMTIPFVGAAKGNVSYTKFGYIFGGNSSNVPSSLKTVVITEDTSIGSSAFSGCTGLTSITIPESVTSIGSYAFYNCSGLTSIAIPASVTSIGECAFGGCSSLESMTIPFVGAVAGKTASDKYQYPFGYIFGTSSYTGGTAVTQYYYGSSTSSTTNTTYYIPSSLRNVTVTGGNILYGAFYNCSMLTSVTLGEDVMSIGGKAFYNCTGLTAINFIGTKGQWDAMSKGYNWDYNTGNYALHYVGEETSEE